MLSGRIDEPFTRSDSGGALFPLLDGLGSSLSLTDSAGAVQTDYSYSAFGQPATTGSSNNNANQYTGRENDETSVQYNRARYYSPTLQRFISEDPIGATGGDFNFYAYVKNNPVSLIDPSGLATGEIGLAGSGKIIGGVVGSISIAIDDSGNVGLVFSGGPGAGIAAEFRGGVMCHVSNANTIEDLGGPFVNGSVSAGMGPDVALDGFVGRNGDGSPLVGGGFTVGAGAGGGGAISVTWTKVIPLFKFGGRGCQDTKNLPPPRPLPPTPTPTPTPPPGPPCDLPIPMICYPDPIPQPAPEPRR